jgi:hypothetical protein
MLEWMGRGPKIKGPIIVSEENREVLEEITGAFRIEGANVRLEPAPEGLAARVRARGKLLFELHGPTKAIEGVRASLAQIESFQERVANAREVTFGIIDRANDARLTTGAVIGLVNEIRKGNVPSLFNKTWIE